MIKPPTSRTTHAQISHTMILIPLIPALLVSSVRAGPLQFFTVDTGLASDGIFSGAAAVGEMKKKKKKYFCLCDLVRMSMLY